MSVVEVVLTCRTSFKCSAISEVFVKSCTLVLCSVEIYMNCVSVLAIGQTFYTQTVIFCVLA
jgi:hypothetical protein